MKQPHAALDQHSAWSSQWSIQCVVTAVGTVVSTALGQHRHPSCQHRHHSPAQPGFPRFSQNRMVFLEKPWQGGYPPAPPFLMCDACADECTDYSDDHAVPMTTALL